VGTMRKILLKVIGAATIAGITALATFATPTQINLTSSGQFAISGSGGGAVTLGSGAPFSVSGNATGMENGSAVSSFTLSSLSGPISFSGSGNTFTSTAVGVTLMTNVATSTVTSLKLTEGSNGEVTLSGGLVGGGSFSGEFNLGAGVNLNSSFTTSAAVTPTPEPGTLLLLGTGLLALCGLVFFKNKKSSPDAVKGFQAYT